MLTRVVVNKPDVNKITLFFALHVENLLVNRQLRVGTHTT